MQQLQAQIAEIDSQIKREVTNFAGGVKSQYDAAVDPGKPAARAALRQTRKQVLVTQDNSIDLNLLKREVDTNRQLYDSLLERLKQVNISSNLTTNNVSIVDSANVAAVPVQAQPAGEPARRAWASACSSACASCSCWSTWTTRSGIPTMVERVLGVPLMGVIPVGDKKRSDVERDRARRAQRPALDDGGGVPLGAHRAAVLDVARRAEATARHQHDARRRQEHHGARARDQLRADGPPRAAGRRRHAQPVGAQDARASRTTSACRTCCPTTRAAKH